MHTLRALTKRWLELGNETIGHDRILDLLTA